MSLLAVSTTAAQVMLAVALALAVWRLIRGRHLADRVVALDLVAVAVVGLVAVDSIRLASPMLLRPALLLALVGFLATVAAAHNVAYRRASTPGERASAPGEAAARDQGTSLDEGAP